MLQTLLKILIPVLAVAVIMCIVLTACRKREDPPSMHYVTEFEVADTLPDGGGKPVRIVLVNGQSNSAGCSRLDYLERKSTAEDYAEYTAGYQNVKINYFCDNGGNLSEGFCPVTIGQGMNNSTFGPELGLAEYFKDTYPDEEIFIIKYSWGGTNLHTQWRAPSSEGDTGPMYTAFINYTKTSMDYLRSKNYQASIVAMCWMQGEADADEQNGPAYLANLTDFVGDIRTELANYICSDGMLFVDAGISESTWMNGHHIAVNNSKVAFAALSDQNIYIDTIAAGMIVTEEPEEAPDMWHFDSLSEIKLGKLYGESIAEYGR